VVARSIAMDHAAGLEVSSELGAGTEFRIEFPPRGEPQVGREKEA